jgi:hypothetical protein
LNFGGALRWKAQGVIHLHQHSQKARPCFDLLVKGLETWPLVLCAVQVQSVRLSWPRLMLLLEQWALKTALSVELIAVKQWIKPCKAWGQILSQCFIKVAS